MRSEPSIHPSDKERKEMEQWSRLTTSLEELDQTLQAGGEIQWNNNRNGLDDLEEKLSSTKTGGYNHHGGKLLELTSRVLLRLTALIKVDSDLYYNPRELERTTELIKAQTDFIKTLDSKIRLISNLVTLSISIQTDNNNNELVDSYFESRCELIYRLSCWCSTGYTNDEWVLQPELAKLITTTIDKLWLIPYTSIEKIRVRDWNLTLEISYMILDKQIKPLFTHLSSRHINPLTGRKIDLPQEHLFGPTSNSLDEPIWKIEGIGLWNAICILLDRLNHDPGLNHIWPLLIPPIITLIENNIPRYRLPGIQLSIHLLRNVSPTLICQSGINSILQNAYTNTFGLLNLKQTYKLLKSTFEANIQLIKLEYDHFHNQEDRYNKLNKLIEDSIWNALSFGKKTGSEGVDLHVFAFDSFMVVSDQLGFGMGRYIRVIIPYLCETLLNLQILDQDNYKIVLKINSLIKRLFHTCFELLIEWKSRLIVVYSSCWIEWSSPSTLSENRSFSGEDLLKVRDSIIEDVFHSMGIVTGAEKEEDLVEMIRIIKTDHPILNQLFDPLYL
ncbi:hypothetical protein PSHT_07821 [Puccinia striiformis]|uniref:Uncharacterized protein n=1 Tax=Puccinia striiformis TaxID=27350 RepID=A0A2S4VUX9_9BASI|nr:hypothetical protein PSHT_07821 [Puccinia striiformis]